VEGDHLSMMEVPFCNLLGASIARALTVKGKRPVTAKGTIAFILFPETSAFNASYSFARELKRSGYRVIYQGPAKYRSRVADQGFEYRSLDMLLPQAEVTRTARMTIQHRLMQLRASDVRCETALIADQVDLVISDPSARIGVLPALKLGIPMVALSSTLATRRAKGTPPVFSSLTPPDVPTVAWKVRNAVAWGRCLLAAWRKRAAETGRQLLLRLGKDSFWADVRRAGGSIAWNEYGPRVDLPELVTSPRGFDFRRTAADPSRTYLGSSVDLRRADGDFSWDGLSAEKKTIYCSLGTYSHEYRRARRLFAAVIDAVRDRDDVQAILQIGSAAEIADFGDLPAHIRVVKFAPQLEILSKADVLITQAGHSSVMEASYFGVPMLAFPCWYDQFGNAARVAYHGTGIVGDIARIDGTKLADMLETLDRGEFKAAASRMRAIFRSEMKPAAGVAVVEQTMRST